MIFIIKKGEYKIYTIYELDCRKCKFSIYYNEGHNNVLIYCKKFEHVPCRGKYGYNEKTICNLFEKK